MEPIDPARNRSLTRAARDAALGRLRRLRFAVAAGATALVAAFAVLAHAATPPYQKRRHALVTATAPVSSPRTRSRTHVGRSHHRRRHRREARSTGSSASVAPSSPATTPTAPAPAPVQPPPAPPAASQQAPATTSGGS